jgi:hypothetical protein
LPESSSRAANRRFEIDRGVRAPVSFLNENRGFPVRFVFYARDGQAAKAKAAELRKTEKARAVDVYACREAEPVASIEFLPCVPADERDRLSALFAGAIVEQPADVGTDALSEIRSDPNWRQAKGRGVVKLKAIAAAVSGRTPADGSEAVAMIEAALAAEKAAAVVEQPPAPVPPPPPG